MVQRDWFCLALRLFGLWLLIQSIEQFAYYVLMVIATIEATDSAPGIYYMASAVLAFIVRTIMGLVLLWFAPAIAMRFYPRTESTEVSHVDSETRPLQVGIQILGLYALLLAVQSASDVIVHYLRGASNTYLTSLFTCGLNLIFGAMLILWNERVLACIERMRYVPERDAYEPPPLRE